MRLSHVSRFASTSFAASLALVAPFAFAQAPAPEPAPTSPASALPTPSPAPSPDRVTPPVVSQTDDASWKYRYDLARDRLVNGDFASAASMFDALANETRDPTERALAKAQGDLAREWQLRGLVLIKHSALGESALTAKAVNERTTDELAVLYTSSVLYGIGTGAWIGTATKAESAAGYVLPMVLFSGAAAGTVALLDSGRPLRYGVPQSIVSGMYIGLEEGIVLALWNGAGDSSAQWEGKTIATVVWGSATAGAIAGGVLGRSVGTTPGRASFVGSTALWSGVITGLAAGAFTPKGSSAQGPLLAAAIGLNAGALGGILAAGPVSPSIARVRFLDLGGIAGGLLFGGLYLAATDKNGGSAQAFTGTTAFGMAAGLGVAWWATSGMPEDRLEEHRAGGDSDVTTPKKSSFTFSPTLMPAKQGMMIGAQGTL